MNERPEVELRTLSLEDLDAVSDIHLRAFPEAALTALGLEAVRRQYRWFLEGPHDAVCTGAWLGGRLMGYCFSGLFKGATGGFLRKNRAFLIGTVLRRPSLLGNPLFRERAALALRLLNPFRKKHRHAPTSWWKGYGVLAIAVDPQAQGLGVGRSLMRFAESVARERKVPIMILTVGAANEAAIRFYEGLGWRKTGDTGSWISMEKSLEDGTN